MPFSSAKVWAACGTDRSMFAAFALAVTAAETGALLAFGPLDPPLE